ncbi:hypothetical protein LSH36_823g01024 [Paralvinella palmiformis]|uniref:Uncharacterized protein n=1 Tax=Paralvinella palmiformis TaxID=53620 RepID=A0AAD9MSD7_9ANNE|nr:hypothetical protein LSH36_823g01024 [Paralvinella palmiformis]
MGRKNRLKKVQKKIKVVTDLNESKKKKTECKYSIDQLLDKAEEYIDSFNYDLAQKFCQRALEIDANHIRALEMFGTLLLETGDTDHAKQCLSHAIELEPDKGHSKYMYLAQLLTGQDAINCFNRGVNIMKEELHRDHPELTKEDETSTKSFKKCSISNDLDGTEDDVLLAEQYDRSDTDEEGDDMYDETVTHEQIQRMFMKRVDDDDFFFVLNQYCCFLCLLYMGSNPGEFIGPKSSPGYVTYCGILPPLGMSKHAIIYSVCSHQVTKIKSYKKEIWKYRQADIEGLNIAIGDFPFGEILPEDVNHAAEIWTHTILTIAKEFIPWHSGASSPQSKSSVTMRDLSSGYCSMAEIYLTDSCFEEEAESKCKRCLEEALIADGSNPEVYHLQASYFISVNDIQSAQQSVEKGISLWLPKLREAIKPEGASDLDPIELCPVNYPCRVNVVKTLIELGNYELSTEILELLLDEDDTVVEVWYLLGWANFLQGNDYKSTAKYYLEQAQKVSKDTQFDDDQLIAHIDELLEEIGQVADNEDGIEDEADENMEVELETDSDNDKGTDGQMDH